MSDYIRVSPPVILTKTHIAYTPLLCKPNGHPHRYDQQDFIRKDGLVIPLTYGSMSCLDFIDGDASDRYSSSTALICWLHVSPSRVVREYNITSVPEEEQPIKQDQRRISFSDVFVRAVRSESEQVAMAAYLHADGDIHKTIEIISRNHPTVYMDYKILTYAELAELCGSLSESTS